MILPFLFLLSCTADKDTGDSASPDSGLSIVNAGPDGAGFSINDCAPDDGGALNFKVGLDEAVCNAEVPDDFWMSITVFPNDFISGAEIPLNSDAFQGYAVFHDSGALQGAVDGTVTIDFSGEWADGIDYTGYYWVELESGLVIEGSFNGVHCGGDIMCG